MSSALRERLKRARRSFTSPGHVIKQLKIQEDEVPHTVNEERNQQDQDEADDNRNETMRTHEDALSRSDSPQTSRQDLLQLREKLKKDVKEKSEMLRRLKMVKMYRTKNDLTELQTLIQKWRRCAQTALYELQTELSTDAQGSSLSQLIDHFGLDDEILHFNRAENDFTDE
ncbi:swi5-dependent recombination DNA repair protein 1 homolog isoform X2 [Trichomycterus rosablanca]